MTTPVRHLHARLQDILQNIDGLLDATAGLQVETIQGSYILLRTTERALQIIAQAAQELPADLLKTEPAVPWSNIIGIGNLVVREHSRLDPNVLSNILSHELPTLRTTVLRLMERIQD